MIVNLYLSDASLLYQTIDILRYSLSISRIRISASSFFTKEWLACVVLPMIP